MEFNKEAYIEKLQPAAPKLFRSQRDELVRQFICDEQGDPRGIKLTDRKTKELRDATEEEVAILLARKFRTDYELYGFLRRCENARSFTRWFWTEINPKKPR